MLLASVAAIRTELGFDDMTDINAAITAALQSAEPQLEVALHTPFRRTEATDTFWVKHPTIMDAEFHETEFWFRRGFLAGAPTASASLMSDGAAVVLANGSLVYNLEKGTARDWTTRYRHAKVAFSYTAGFEADMSNPQSYDLTQVPPWLQEATKLLALARIS